MLLKPGDSFVRQIRYLISHKSSVNAVAFSPDSELIATASDDHRVQLWHSNTGIRGNILKGHRQKVTHVTFSPDGSLIASGSRDGTVILWMSATGAKCASLIGDKEIFALAFMPNSSLVMSACFDMSVELWRCPTGEKINALRGVVSSVDVVVFSSDSEMIAFASDDMTVRLRKLRTGWTWSMLGRHQDRITAMAFSPDCKLVASASHDMTVKLWELDNGLERKTIDVDTGPVTAVAFGPSGNLLVCGSRESTIRLYDIFTGSQIYMIHGYSGRKITNVAVSPDGTLVASAFDDGMGRLLHLDVKAIHDACRDPQVLPSNCDQSSCHSMIDTHSSAKTDIARSIDPIAGIGRAASFVAKNSTASKPADMSIDGDEDYIIKCICGFKDDDGNTVFCELCETWQHIRCYYHCDHESIPDLSKIEHRCIKCDPRPVDAQATSERQKNHRNSLIHETSKRRRTDRTRPYRPRV